MSDSIASIKRLFDQHRPRIVALQKELAEIDCSNHVSDGISELILNKLACCGLHPEAWGDNGVTLTIPGKSPSLTVALLLSGYSDSTNLVLPDQPADEVTDDARLSQIGETLIGVGVVALLSDLKDELMGTVRIFFNAGARAGFSLPRDGFLEETSAYYALALTSCLTEGQAGVKFGPTQTSQHRFEIRLFNKNGVNHPSNRPNVLQAAARAVIALPQIPARRINPLKPAIISVSSIGNGPDPSSPGETIILGGCFKAADEALNQEIPDLIEQTLKWVGQVYHIGFVLRTKRECPNACGDLQTSTNLLQAAGEILGDERATKLEFPSTDSASLSDYFPTVPGSILHLGVACNSSVPPPSSPVDSNSLEAGVEAGIKTLTWALVRHLKAANSRTTTSAVTG